MNRIFLLKRIWKYMKPAKWLMLGALLLNVICNLLALSGPKLSGMAISAIEPGEGKVDHRTVMILSVIMIVFYVVSSLLSYILALIMRSISQGMAKRMRSEIFEKLSRLPVGFFDTHQAGDIISRVTYDIDTVHTCMSSDILQIFTSVITVVVSFIMMVTISPVLILIFIVTIPVTIFVTRYLSGRVRPLYRKRSGKLGEMNGFAEEYTSGLSTIKAYYREQTALNRFDAKNKEAVTAYYNADYAASAVGPTVNMINNISLALVSIFGALLYMAGSMNLGDVSSFVLYSRKFSGPINETANILAEIQSAFAAAERIFRLLDEEIEVPDGENAIELNEAPSKVTFDNVNFGYSPDRQIINDLNLKVPAGSLIAIVGHTGAGKTTIINLLMRFYDVDSGSISMDSDDIRDITRASMRARYTMVLQDTWLFYGTVFENIAYGAPYGTKVTLEDVQRVAKAAKIHDTIMKMPKGYDTILSDNATNISKGQKQLLTIARAMLASADLLILDEATSNVDVETEMAIREAMNQLMKDKTCFVIAHRLSTVVNADTIVVVDDGRIVEMGTHSELLKANGTYAELYNSQFGE